MYKQIYVNKIVYFYLMEFKQIDIIKGIHPGFILERELSQRQLAKGQFALSLHEFPQTITAITKGKRRMNTSLALKIEKALGMEEGFFMILQVYHDIAIEKQKEKAAQPNLSLLRPILFWDTDIRATDWEKQHKAVISRVFERGNSTEKNEILRFYGKATVDKILKERGHDLIL